MGGGGVASDYAPIHSLQPTPEEIRAAVQAASDWGTYVLAHSYTAPTIRRLVENGVRVIEHGLLIDDETARMCAEAGVVISTQIAVFRNVGDMPGRITAHLAAYGYLLPALRDPEHDLVSRCGATVAPEAVVYKPDGTRVYRGRIDDRDVDFGRQRPAATQHDLAWALDATLAGCPVIPPTTTAVGCYIADRG